MTNQSSAQVGSARTGTGWPSCCVTSRRGRSGSGPSRVVRASAGTSPFVCWVRASRSLMSHRSCRPEPGCLPPAGAARPTPPTHTLWPWPAPGWPACDRLSMTSSLPSCGSWSTGAVAWATSTLARCPRSTILLLELIPGGAKKDLSAQAKALLATVRPRDLVPNLALPKLDTARRGLSPLCPQRRARHAHGGRPDIRPARRFKHATTPAPIWGSRGRRFKSCQPDGERAGQSPASKRTATAGTGWKPLTNAPLVAPVGVQAERSSPATPRTPLSPSSRRCGVPRTPQGPGTEAA